MKKFLISAIVILILLVLLTVIYDYRKNSTKSTNIIPSPETSSTTPVVGPTGVAIQTPNGPVTIADIRSMPITQDSGLGLYHVDETKAKDIDGFEILYSSTDGSFTISIEKKPLSVYREKASQYFLQLFNVSQLDACKLHVLVGVPAEVDQKLAGKNVGFSFCPDSVTLP